MEIEMGPKNGGDLALNDNFYKSGVLSVLIMITNTLAGLLQFYLFSAYLPTELFGNFQQILLFNQIFSFVIIFGTDMTIKQFLPPIKKQKKDISAFLTNILFMQIIVALFISISFWFFPATISSLLLGENNISTIIPFLPLLFSITALTLTMEYIMHSYYRFKEILLAYILSFILLISGILFFLFILEITIFRILFIMILSIGIKGVIYLNVFIKLFTREHKSRKIIDSKYITIENIKKFFSVYLWFGVLLISDNILRTFDKLYINSNLPTRDFAIYSFYYTIAFIIFELIIGFKNLINPYIREYSFNKSNYQYLSLLMIKFGFILSGVLILFKDIIFIIIPNPDFQSYPIVLDLLIFAFFIFIFNVIPQAILFANGKIKEYIIPIIIAMIVIMILNASLIDTYGILLPPISMAIGYLLLYMMYQMIIKQKKLDIIFHPRSICYPFGLLILIICPTFLIKILIYGILVLLIIISEKLLIRKLFKSIFENFTKK